MGHLKTDDTSTELELRKLLAFSHTHRHSSSMYFDDGELQCNVCGIDFKRDSPAIINALIYKQALKEFNEQL
jgi:transposase